MISGYWWQLGNPSFMPVSTLPSPACNEQEMSPEVTRCSQVTKASRRKPRGESTQVSHNQLSGGGSSVSKRASHSLGEQAQSLTLALMAGRIWFTVSSDLSSVPPDLFACHTLLLWGLVLRSLLAQFIPHSSIPHMEHLPGKLQ